MRKSLPSLFDTWDVGRIPSYYMPSSVRASCCGTKPGVHVYITAEGATTPGAVCIPTFTACLLWFWKVSSVPEGLRHTKTSAGANCAIPVSAAPRLSVLCPMALCSPWVVETCPRSFVDVSSGMAVLPLGLGSFYPRSIYGKVGS
jgi:hypothetical protein